MIDVETLLRIRNDDELFFKYILNLTVTLISTEENVEDAKEIFTTNSIKYILESIFKACVLSSFLINQTSEMEEEELVSHSKVNFERIRRFVEERDPTFQYLMDAFHEEVKLFLE